MSLLSGSFPALSHRFSTDLLRHGARLDAADKDWHLTSPTPYDPPLCYGGWIQSRALGVRIASLLQTPDFIGTKPDESPDVPTSASDLYNQYNVIIHTSPYLRCLQTSIAISAGLSQSRPNTEDPEDPEDPLVDTVSPDLRPLVRVDAFLGEWLSPDYFDQITPPPGSDRMVALAKAELLRRGEILPSVREGTRALSGHFPGGWGSQSYPTSPNEDDGAASGPILSVKNARQRASTFDVPQGPALGRLDINRPAKSNASYVAPTPGYAVSPADRIPSGYVSHARDACTKIDYQWDSMRSPFWGTGGEYGEEWSSMQERVSDSFQQMMEWYQKPESSARSRATTNNALRQDRSAQTVIIIVTHGAGCNALINSLAGHPVLLDIGTASVTLAVPRNRLPINTPDSDRSSKSFDPADRPISHDYTLQLVASTDHLRPGSNPSQLTSLTSLSAPQPPPQSFRNRLGSRHQPLQGSFPLGPISGAAMSPRGWALAAHPSTSEVPRVSGLWGAIASPIENDEDAEDFVPNFGDQRPVSHDSPLPDGPVDRTGWTKQLPKRTLSQRGLWGSAPSLEDRESASRRRWTLAEQKL